MLQTEAHTYLKKTKTVVHEVVTESRIFFLTFLAQGTENWQIIKGGIRLIEQQNEILV